MALDRCGTQLVLVHGMNVRDVMTRQQVACCTPEATLHTAACLMAARDCGALPVIDLDRFPIGMITDRDIVVRGVTEDAADMTVRDCMTAPAITIDEDTDLDDCIDLLERAQIRRIIVVDNHGKCVGIVAQADIAAHVSKRKAGELLRYLSRPSEAVEPPFATS
jgi:CBS domain-containing protein